MKKASIILAITSVMMLVGFWFYPRNTPEQAFNEFLSHETKESYLTQPLCSAGEKVVPLVIEKIKDKELKRRRYAIGFLGSGDYLNAIPTLEKIVNDANEKDYIRGDALNSIYLIDESIGVELARKYRNKNDFLGKISMEILAVKDYQEYKKKNQTEICDPSD